MIAGTIELGGAKFRIHTNWRDVARLAAAATLGIDGTEGVKLTRNVARDLVDQRDRARWLRAVARATPAEFTDAVAAMVAVNLAAAAASPDPGRRAWAVEFREATEQFQAGDREAFARLADRRWAAEVGL